MGSRERRERERQDTRERILDAAREMFATRGVEATTMRAIAQRIEYTPTAIYHHFRDKDELILELCHRDFLMLAQHFARVGRIDDPIERLRMTGLAYLEFGLQFPHHYRVMFMTEHPHPELALERRNPEEDAYGFLLDGVAEAIRAGRLRPELDNPEMVAQMLWGAVHGVVALHVAKHEDRWVDWQDPRETAASLIDAVMRGIGREPA
jgi:AcrR family transcriptional regulator